MTEDRNRGETARNPEDRAFTGKPDMPPSEPDQPEVGNEELQRPESDDDKEDANGGYVNLPGYGG